MKRIPPFPFFLGLFIVIFVVFIIIVFCFNIHYNWRNFDIKEEIDFISINTSIALMNLVISTITIIYVFKTYETQNQQIKQSKFDADYNRSLDLIYKQYEISKEKMENQNLKGKIDRFISNNYDSDSLSLSTEYIILEDDFIQSYVQVSHFIIQQLEFIYKVLDKSYLENEDKRELAQLIPNNLNSNLVRSLTIFCNKVIQYHTTKDQLHGHSSYLNQMFDDTQKILKFLFLNENNQNNT